MNKTAYDILNVSYTATEEEIKRQYHTLMRNVHSTFGLETEEDDLSRIREYNDAFAQLTKGNRESYDASLQLSYDLKSDESANKKVKSTTPNQHFSKILHGFSFLGSIPSDSNQKQTQEYLKAQSNKRRVEKGLYQAKQKARIGYLQKASTNSIQLGIEIKKIESLIVSLEFERDSALAHIQENYVFQASKRTLNQKKREILKKQAETEAMKVNEKYDSLIEEKRKQKEKLQVSLEEVSKKEQEAIGINPDVQKLKASLTAINNQIATLTRKSVNEHKDNGSRISF